MGNICPSITWVINEEGLWSNEVIEMNHEEICKLVETVVMDLLSSHVGGISGSLYWGLTV